MDPYTLLIFLHVLGGIGIFVTMGLELVALRRLRLATTPESASVWLALVPRWLGPLAMLTTFVAGVAMMALRWGPAPWIVLAVIGLVAMAVLAGAVSLRGTRRMAAALAAESSAGLSAAFRSEAQRAALLVSLSVRIAIAIGIVALMTLKPDAPGSLLIGATSTGAGLIAGRLLAARRPTATELWEMR